MESDDESAAGADDVPASPPATHTSRAQPPHITPTPDRRSQGKANTLASAKLHPEVENAIIVIQSLGRRYIARERVVSIVRRRYELNYDNETNDYFFFDTIRDESVWTKPSILWTRQIYHDGKEAVRGCTKIQSLVRQVLAKQVFKARVIATIQKGYDPDSGDFFYTNKKTKETVWTTPSHLVSQFGGDELELDYESKLLLQRDDEIAKLRAELAARDVEIDKVRQERMEELKEESRSKQLVDALRGGKRSKDMDEWTVEHVAAWIGEMEQLDKYAPAFVANRIDGLLLLNLDNDDLGELGMKSLLHQRRFNVAIKKYKARYENKQAGEDLSDGEDGGSLGSETPSELLDEMEEQISESEESEGDSDDELLPTEEEVIEMRQDKENIKLRVKFQGNNTDYPKYGDVVRCHYTMYIQKPKDIGGMEKVVIESTRKMRGRPMEFVLGGGQVITGFERALMKMALQERSEITISPLYAYGEEGAPPLIPPNTPIELDVELLDIRKKPVYKKALIQTAGHSVVYPEEPGRERRLPDYDHAHYDEEDADI